MKISVITDILVLLFYEYNIDILMDILTKNMGEPKIDKKIIEI